MDLSWLPPGQDPKRLPLGMRVNNPGNIKFFPGLKYPGMLGPSDPGHTDQGDPQMVFDTPQSGMNAAAKLAWKKYQGGKRSPNALIAGPMGWTPGNTAAAANVARTLGISPDADMNLANPQQMSAFLRALTTQEHGGSAKLYGEDLYTNAATSAVNGQPMPVGSNVGRNVQLPMNPGVMGAAAQQPVPPAQLSALAQALTPPDPRDAKLADAYLAQATSAQPQGWGDLVRALGGMVTGQGYAQKHSEAEKEYRSKLALALGGASTPDQMTQTLIGSGDPALQQAGIQAMLQQAQAQAKAGAPLRGKERYMVTPNGVMDVETQQIIPGTERATAGTKAPSGYRQTQDGNLEFIPGGPADPAVKPKGRDKFTEGQTKAANFGNMMVQADKALLEMTPKGPDGQPLPLENPKGVGGAIRDSLVPFEGLRNKMTSGEEQAYKQVAAQWIRAKLRKESGAAIGEQEMEQEFQTYFPQWGDGPEVIARKAAAREQAMKGMLAESGGAYQQLFPQEEVAAPNEATDAPQPPALPAAPKQYRETPKAKQALISDPSPEKMRLYDELFGPGAAQRAISSQQQQTPSSMGIIAP